MVYKALHDLILIKLELQQGSGKRLINELKCSWFVTKVRIWWEQFGESGGVRHLSGAGRENGRTGSQDRKGDKCEEGRKFPFPPLLLLAGWIIKSTGDRLTRKKSNLISCSREPHMSKESETPHTWEVQRQKGGWRCIRHPELGMRSCALGASKSQWRMIRADV